MKEDITLELTALLDCLIKYKEFLEDKKANVQIFQLHKALTTAIFWIEAYLK